MNDPENYCDTVILFPPGVTITERPTVDPDHWTHQIGGEPSPIRIPRRRKPIQSAPKAGRNEPCPCGSGQKYKRCCREK